ncbi:MAG: hypothetical protein K8R53_03190 [Bacteroidales bacterium]|nr:hypothetical protein [Bacteroidales bacterium]
MKLHLLCKYLGLITGGFAGLLLIAGIIGYFSGEFLNVTRFTNFFWFANSFLFFAIFCMVVNIACKDKKE